MNEYTDLQKEATSLGLKAVGVSKEALKNMIAEAKNNPDAAKPSEDEMAPEQPAKKAGKPNTAVVYQGVTEIRRYTTEKHGKNFEKLAREFAQDRGYTVELITVNFEHKCPNCGYQL